MDKKKTLGLLIVIPIFSILMAGCGQGGDSPQGEVVGMAAQAGNSNPQGGGPTEDKPSVHNDPQRGGGEDIQPGGTSSDTSSSGKGGNSGGNAGNSGGQGSNENAGNNPGNSGNNTTGSSASANNQGNSGSNQGNPGNNQGNSENNQGNTENNQGNPGNNQGNSENNQGNSGNNQGNSGGTSNQNGESVDLFDLPVSVAFNSQLTPKIVYQPGRERFLVIWNDLRNRDGFDYHGWGIYGQFVNSSGQFEGNNFPISSEGAEYRTAPLVAHDEGTGRALVVWQTTTGDILGQMINTDGTLSGGIIVIANSRAWEVDPALAFDPMLGRFFVAWINSASGFSIHGRLLDRDGNFLGDPFPISEAISGKLELQAAAATVQGKILLTWRDYRGVDIYSIYGQLVNSDGTLDGPEIIIADAKGAQIQPALSYDSESGCFLVIWSDDRRGPYEIYGQLVAVNGLLIGVNFPVSPYGGYSHSVAFEPTNPHHLITFSKFGKRIFGIYVASDGLVSGEDFILSDLEGTQFSPHLSYDPKQKKFLAAWTDHRNASADIYGRNSLLNISSGPCDGQADPLPQGCASEGDAMDQIIAACGTSSDWNNHGEYVSCVAKKVKELRQAGILSAQTALNIITQVSEAARSDIGKK